MYKQRDIILIPMPYTDLSAEKKRPALVLSDDTYNENSSDILAVMITSTRHRMPYDITICKDDMASGELPKQSYVRSDRGILHRTKIGCQNIWLRYRRIL